MASVASNAQRRSYQRFGALEGEGDEPGHSVTTAPSGDLGRGIHTAELLALLDEPKRDRRRMTALGCPNSERDMDKRKADEMRCAQSEHK